MEVVTDGARARLVIVSDGEVLAHVQKFPGVKPSAAVERLPGGSSDDTHAKDQAAQGVPFWLPGVAAARRHCCAPSSSICTTASS